MKVPTNLLSFLFAFFLIRARLSSQFMLFRELCLDDVGTYSTNSLYQKNLNLLLSDLGTQASSILFSNHTVGQGIDQVYGLYMCRGDLNVQQCHGCVQAASSTLVEKCPVQKEAIVWYLQCMVRYANRNIFSTVEVSPLSYVWSLRNISNPVEFAPMLTEMVDGLITEAAHNTSMKGYAFGRASVTLFEDVYVLMQCTEDILGSSCERCLRVAFENMEVCCGVTGIKLAIFMPSCWLRHELAPRVEPFSTPLVSSPSPFLPPSTPPT